MMSYKKNSGFKMMGCMVGFYTMAIAVIITVLIVIDFQNKANAWNIIAKFIYLLADLNLGSALGILLFSNTGDEECRCHKSSRSEQSPANHKD